MINIEHNYFDESPFEDRCEFCFTLSGEGAVGTGRYVFELVKKILGDSGASKRIDADLYSFKGVGVKEERRRIVALLEARIALAKQSDQLFLATALFSLKKEIEKPDERPAGQAPL